MTSHPIPILTVDVIALSLRQGDLCYGVIRRAEPPFLGEWALPGGYVHIEKDADLTATALRVLREKSGVTDCLCEQLGTFSGRERDPRGWAATVVYYAVLRDGLPQAQLNWASVSNPLPLAFDHNQLLQAAIARLRAKGSWSTLPAFFLPRSFTFLELRRIYELVLGINMNDSAFRRKIEELDLIEPVVGQKSKASARPAQLYRLKHQQLFAFDRHI
ncbi:MAG: NUDIX hydrolase [Rhodobacter sp.]|nr:NUDIX hydrolase [Rhodobacter sp.]